MLTYKLDTITKGKKTGIFTAYIQVMDGQKIVKTTSLIYNDDDDESFKERLKSKVAKTEADYTEKKDKKTKIEKILEGM